MKPFSREIFGSGGYGPQFLSAPLSKGGHFTLRESPLATTQALFSEGGGDACVSHAKGIKINKQIRWFSVSKVQQTRGEVTTLLEASSLTTQNFKLNPWFITGFTDAEGSFSVIVLKSNNLKVQWQARLYFQISLHVKDKILLEQIKNFFGVGEIYTKTSDSIIYTVKSIKDLTVIINHFEKYPLITQKWTDYEIFKQAFILIKNKEHLTLGGLNQIVALKAAMNWGISKELKTAFTTMVSVQKPLVKNQVVQDPNWLAGFVSGVASPSEATTLR
jgi:hypothetical protein